MTRFPTSARGWSGVLCAAAVMTVAATAVATGGSEPTVAPPASPASQPAPAPPAGGDPSAAADRNHAVVRADYGILRRAKGAGDPPGHSRAVVAANGKRAYVSVDDRGLCVQPTFGGVACGAAEKAATHPVLLHRMGGDTGTDVAGLAPDGVAAIEVLVRGRTRRLEVRENTFEASVNGPIEGLDWVMRDGRRIRQLPK